MYLDTIVIEANSLWGRENLMPPFHVPFALPLRYTAGIHPVTFYTCYAELDQELTGTIHLVRRWGLTRDFPIIRNVFP